MACSSSSFSNDWQTRMKQAHHALIRGLCCLVLANVIGLSSIGTSVGGQKTTKLDEAAKAETTKLAAPEPEFHSEAWWEWKRLQEKAEDDRLKRRMSICRGC